MENRVSSKQNNISKEAAVSLTLMRSAGDESLSEFFFKTAKENYDTQRPPN